jgi:hypothetical protein
MQAFGATPRPSADVADLSRTTAWLAGGDRVGKGSALILTLQSSPPNPSPPILTSRLTALRAQARVQNLQPQG